MANQFETEASGPLGTLGAEAQSDETTGALPRPKNYDELAADFLSAERDVAKFTKDYRAMIDEGRSRLRDMRVGPTASEQLFAIASAFGRPTRTGRFGERMAMVGEVLGGQEKAKREADMLRQKMLEEYGLKGAELGLESAQKRATTLGQMMARQAAANKPATPVWAADLNQFVSRDKPVPTPNKVQVGNLVLTQYTDGNLYLRNADGSKSVYSPEGVKIGDIPAGGAR